VARDHATTASLSSDMFDAGRDKFLSAQKLYHQLVHGLRRFAGRKMTDTRNDAPRIVATEVFVFPFGRFRQSDGVGTRC
jgi:hypothetical protein